MSGIDWYAVELRHDGAEGETLTPEEIAAQDAEATKASEDATRIFAEMDALAEAMRNA